MAIGRSQNYRYRRYGLSTAALLGVVTVFGAQATPTADAPAAWQNRIAQTMTRAGDAPAARYQYHVLAGEMALAADDKAGAAEQYAKALAIDADPALAEQAARVAVAADRPDLAYPAVRVWAKARPDVMEAQRAAVRLAFVGGDVKGVATFGPRLVATAASKRAGYRQLASLLADQPSHADTAIDALQQLANNAPQAAGPAYALALVALHYGRLDVAGQAADRATRQAPDWGRAGMLASAIDVRQTNFDAARKRVAGLPGDAQIRAGYHVALARYLLQAGKQDAGADEFRRALEIVPDQADARYGLGLVSLSDGDLDTAHRQFEALSKTLGDNKTAQANTAFYLGVVAERQNRPEDAERWYARVDDGEHVFDAGIRSAFLASEQGDIDGALARLDTLAKRVPDQAGAVVAARGELLTRAGRLDQAVSVFSQALADSPDDTDLLYGRSLVYEQLGRIDAAEADLKEILTRDNGDARALNALGYMLTNHSSHYGRAEGYIRKALAQTPDNPAVLDSLGWVQYKQGELDKARRNLEKAHQGSDDPDIAAHLGTVRWQQGDQAAARAIWQKAAKAHPDDKELKQTMEQFGS